MEGIQVSTSLAGRANQISVIKVGGYIDTTTSSEVERTLNNILKQGRYQIIIDLGNVDYISSAGWGIFISEIKSIRENNGDLKLVKMIPDVYEIFELLEFHHILDVYDSVEEAVQKLEESQYVEMVSQGGAEKQQGGVFSAGSGDVGRDRTAPVSGSPEAEIPAEGQGEEEKAATADLASLPVQKKIEHIVAGDPDIGAFKINKILNTAQFGYSRVGWFGVRNWLNKLGLSSRKSRRKFSENYRN